MLIYSYFMSAFIWFLFSLWSILWSLLFKLYNGHFKIQIQSLNILYCFIHLKKKEKKRWHLHILRFMIQCCTNFLWKIIQMYFNSWMPLDDFGKPLVFWLSHKVWTKLKKVRFLGTSLDLFSQKMFLTVMNSCSKHSVSSLLETPR